LVDEAYLHFLPMHLRRSDFVKAGKDWSCCALFRKPYGMAGLRADSPIARPDLIDKITERSGWNFCPLPPWPRPSASLKDPTCLPERKRINATVRQRNLRLA